MEYKSYSDLPRRSIISSAQKSGLRSKDKKLESYGIMARVKDTNKWLMVRTRNSTSLIFILYGAYQPVHFERLLLGLTKDELNKLREIVISGKHETFIDYFYDIFTNHGQTEYAFTRLMDMKEDILLFDKELPDKTPYSFPKGRRNPREEVLVTAMREFYEETGIVLKGNIINTPISYSILGYCDRIYNIKCWISEYNKIIYMDGFDPIDTKEIIERRWIDIDPNLIKGDKYMDEEVQIESISIQLIKECINLRL